MKISVSIVDYNKGDRLCESLQFLNQQSVSDKMIVNIVDNSVEFCNTNKYIQSSRGGALNVNIFRPNKNIGYTLATNVSVDVLSDFVVILNPDILLKDNRVIEKCINYLIDHDDVGVVGVKQLDDSGKIELVSRKYPNVFIQVARRSSLVSNLLFKSKINSYENVSVNHNDDISEVDWLQSSFWIMKTKLWNDIGGLDTDFFLFMSEPDFSFKVKKLGLKIVYLPTVTVFSDGIRCSGGGFLSVFSSKTVRFHIVDAFRYYIKRLYSKFN